MISEYKKEHIRHVPIPRTTLVTGVHEFLLKVPTRPPPGVNYYLTNLFPAIFIFNAIFLLSFTLTKLISFVQFILSRFFSLLLQPLFFFTRVIIYYIYIYSIFKVYMKQFFPCKTFLEQFNLSKFVYNSFYSETLFGFVSLVFFWCPLCVPQCLEIRYFVL